MYRFLLTRRWVMASIVVAAAVVVMVELGFWQLRRLDSVRTQNARVGATLALPAAPVESVLAPGGDPGVAAFRRVEVVGDYDASSELVLESRSFQGRPGTHLLTPLRIPSGWVLIVDRGWVPLRLTDAQREVARPPDGRVRATGILFPSDRRGAFGPSIPASGRLSSVPRVDVPRIAAQLSGPAFPLYLRLASQDPSQGGDLPIPPGPPDLSEGPHLSYAVQWFIFGSLALLTYGALIRRASRKAVPDGTG